MYQRLRGGDKHKSSTGGDAKFDRFWHTICSWLSHDRGSAAAAPAPGERARLCRVASGWLLPFVRPFQPRGGTTMVRLAVLFLVIALIAALFGFGGIAGTAMAAAKIVFFVFIVLAVLSFLGGMLRTPPA
jgi:uncharacterized membrane protein YtjA (UPF0391 family)